MAFVNEEISEEDIQRCKLDQIIRPVSGRKVALPPQYWAVDRERDIALMSLGGGVRLFPQSFFELYWKGQFALAHLILTETGSSKTGDWELTWRLTFLAKLENVPEPEVIETLKEALYTFGYISPRFRNQIKAIHFAFDGKHNTNQ